MKALEEISEFLSEKVISELEILNRLVNTPSTKLTKAIPFKATPHAILLRMTNSDEYMKAQIEYEYSPIDQKIELKKFENSQNHTLPEYQIHLDILEIRKTNGLIELDTYGYCKLVLNWLNDKSSDEKISVKSLRIDLADRDLAHDRITKNQHEKLLATIKEEPWVKVVVELDPNNPKHAGAFQLDWNDYFIFELKTNGYFGKKDEEIVDEWLKELCRVVGYEDQMEDLENENRTVTKTRTSGSGKVDYS